MERVGERLVARGLRLATAESCTGGLLTARLTDPAGASRFLVGGAVSYADEAKVSLLGVKPETLAAYGAVSEQVAREMAEGASAAVGAEMGVAITGVAGPGGGTAEKPVGTVWIAATLEGATRAERHQFGGDRAMVRERSVQAALELLDSLLTEKP
jgi:nicotinamide-nucleotide amidase